jgi:hypothetical protein
MPLTRKRREPVALAVGEAGDVFDAQAAYGERVGNQPAVHRHGTASARAFRD